MSIFADDTAILCSDMFAADIITNLQNALHEGLTYFNKWKILLNSAQTQAIFFTRKRKPCYIAQVTIIINNHSIQWEQKVRYLGVILDPKMKFRDHIPYILNKINVLIRMLYPFINRNSRLNIVNKHIMLKTIFHGIMFYAAPVWAISAKCHIKKLQVSQNKLLKMIYNLPWHFSTNRLHELAHIELVY